MTDKLENPTDFEDLLENNRHYADNFHMAGFDGIAQSGVAIVTCMDSRIDPLGIVGLEPGDAKIFRNPGGRITVQALEALVLSTYLLNVNRILVVPHTRCAMGKNTENELRSTIGELAGKDASWMSFSVVDDQEQKLREDLKTVRSHPLIPDSTLVGGFIYDVDTGLLREVK
ncbi:MAG: carbonic anhydrase [Intrasporangium sp.]|uniref:beta-class carbonic anhydrase n=1 Tax=Intrasporangium sp. TaxID=1925024 RepID=UPI00264A267E|nr:carbonic anhydrase [Intrasporangium sp.]MDN5794264.1 carbonic anhydrase [Intrasporangium sp.]